MTEETLEIRRLGPEWESGLGEFLLVIAAAGLARTFHPHPFTAAEAHSRATYEGKDLYFVAVEGSTVLGYAMLRGWDDGYEIPSLGIAVHPDCQGTGLGRALMLFLHAAAYRRGSRRIRLRVYPDNERALRLYASLGYQFQGEQDGQLVGFVDLR